MVRKYQRKSNRANYSVEDLETALEHVRSGKCGTLRASKLFNIPRSTLKDHLKGRRGTKSTTMGRPTALPAKDEDALANGLKSLEKWGFGLSRKEVLEIVGKYVTEKELKTPFKNNVPGEDWFLKFKERHGLSIKKPEALEYARKKNTDPFIIYPYFQLLENTINELNLQDKPSNIWNMDETSFCSDPSKTKVVGEKGKASTRIVSGPGRTNTSVLFAASADGQKAPPLIIYKGKNVWDTWMADQNKEYPGTTYAATSNGWMESEVFKNYFLKTFIPMVEGNGPVLVIYDGHTTHIDIDLIKAAVAANIAIVKLPPHSSHLLQPLDLTVFKSVKVSWDALLVKWQRNHLGQKLPKSKLAEMVGSIWKDTDPKIISEGFRKGGIYPYNCDVISQEKYDPQQLKRWKAQQSINVSTENEILPDVPNLPLNDEAEILLGDVDLPAIGEDIPVDRDDLLDSQSVLVSVDKETGVNQEATKEGEIVLEGVELMEEEKNLENNPQETLSSEIEENILVLTNEVKSTNVEGQPSTSLGITTENNSHTFEALLLNLVKGNQTRNAPKQSRKRVCPGAELITSEIVRKRLQEDKENEVTKKITAKKKTTGTKVLPAKERKVKKPTKQKKAKRVKSKQIDSETDEDSDLRLDDEESDYETLSEIGEEAMETIDFENTGDKEKQVGDWLLTKLHTERKTVQYFIGKIESLDIETGNPTVKFVRRIKSKTVPSRPAFRWPDVDDISEVESRDTICILPPPTIGRRDEITFGVSFSGYNVN